MALTIPNKSVYTIKRGDTGVPAFAVQRVCNKLGYPTSEDMDFGPKTEASAKKLQQRLGVTIDGVVGPATQRALAVYLCAREENENDLPAKLLFSKISYESGGLLCAVNWSVPGGVDCGMTQRRIYTSQYEDDAVIKRAFDAAYQLDLSGKRARELFEIFLPRPGIAGDRELAWRVSILNHNYPALADRISRDTLTSYYKTPQAWVKSHGLRFPDGHPIETPLQWGKRYSLGAPRHNEPGQAVRLVKSWE